MLTALSCRRECLLSPAAFAVLEEADTTFRWSTKVLSALGSKHGGGRVVSIL